ncbi:MAG: hypothetical protein Q9227_001517 [Pyrenula ochraceoflavens]
MRLVMDTGTTGQGPAAVEVGAFRYHVQPPPGPYPENPRKRKASISSDEDGPRSAKRTETQLRIQENHAAVNYNAAAASPYSPFLPTPTSASVYAPRYQQTASPRSVGHQYSTSATSQTSIAAPSPHTPSWSPSFAPVNQPNRMVQHSMTPAAQPSTGSSPGKATNPPLIRTSTLAQSPSTVSAAGRAPIGGHAFNPYAIYPSKAVLNLNGDLDKMAEGWNMEEWDTKRRLVLFTRSQTGSTIHADFKAVAPEDRPPNSICISCIWWEEKKECFVTSVDTIFLLESLVAVRFTVEEKNRIRRNLEGFRPLTVSKGKADSEEFFKIIMGFPTPKPRNIEKDVKVFPWKILKHALKKIIGKYVCFLGTAIFRFGANFIFQSASYSSTAGALLTPTSSTYPSAGTSDGGAEPHSPGMQHVATSASMYSSSLGSTNYSPRTSVQPRHQQPVSTGPPTDLRLQVPPMSAGYPYSTTYPFNQQQSISAHPHSAQYQQQQQAMTAPVGRGTGSWDFASFMEANPATANPTGMPSMDYERATTSLATSQPYMAAASGFAYEQSSGV